MFGVWLHYRASSLILYFMCEDDLLASSSLYYLTAPCSKLFSLGPVSRQIILSNLSLTRLKMILGFLRNSYHSKSLSPLDGMPIIL